MKYDVEIREVVWDDLEEVPLNLRARILRALERRLAVAPSNYGVRLSQSLAGLWKIRVGDYRVVYEIKGTHVTVWAIRNRRDVYPRVQQRWLRP
ncbi:MAG: type II toxin-antitoxin system RelE/ParE family toxin [Candidatus Omnitrophica bacterium]|nr:type II toxin-antitoxin system RelE/ParE family toxin [Candidatus Omnitrophota bacterium]